MNPGDSSSSIVKSNSQQPVHNKSSVIVNLQKDVQVFMCQKFVQSHWADGMLLAQNGKKLYGAEMRDQNNEYLPYVKDEQLSDVSTVLFQKDIGDDDKPSDIIVSCSDATTAVTQDSINCLSSFSYYSSPKKEDFKTTKLSKCLRTSTKRKRRDVELNSPMKKKSKPTFASKLLKDDHQLSSIGKQKTFEEKACGQTTVEIRNELPPVNDCQIKPKLVLRRINFFTPNSCELCSESGFTQRPIKDRRYSVIPLNKTQSVQQKPISTQTSKQFPQLKKCSVDIKRLKILKPSISHTSGIQEQSSQQSLQMNDVLVKLERVNVAIQCQPKQCDAITQTDRSMVKEKRDFSSQASIPDSAYLAKISALELVIRDLKQALNVREVQHEKNVAALRAAFNVEHVRMNGLSAESLLNQKNKSSQMDVNLKIPDGLLPRQPQRIVARSSSTGMRPKEYNPNNATFRKQTVKPSMLTLPLRQSYPYVQIKEPEKQLKQPQLQQQFPLCQSRAFSMHEH